MPAPLLAICLLALPAGNDASTWTRNGDLEVRLEIPGGLHKAGEEVTVKLHFRNAGKQPLRIYLVVSEAFRFGQSELDLKSANPPDRPVAQPPPRPHGYKVTEKDFHLIQPGAKLAFDQTLRLDKTLVTGPGDYQVVWTYKNKIRRWKGGVQTLDGPTRELFGGKDIPHIWTGSIEAKAVVRVGP
jgi:hypothetical protein